MLQENSAKLTQAFIFAAGRGERMRPLTDIVPKPLVKILGKEILQYSVDKLNEIDSIQKIIINGFYLSDQVKKFIEKQHNPKIIFSQENEKIETGGALVFAQDKINLKKPLLIINGDILWREESNDSQIKKIWQAWLEIKKHDNNCEILLGLKAKNKYHGYDGIGDFELLPKNQIRKDNKINSHAYVGLAIIDPIILQRKPQDQSFSLSYFFKEKLSNNGDINNIRAIELSANFFHIGDIAAIKNSADILQKVLQKS